MQHRTSRDARSLLRFSRSPSRPSILLHDTPKDGGEPEEPQEKRLQLALVGNRNEGEQSVVDREDPEGPRERDEEPISATRARTAEETVPRPRSPPSRHRSGSSASATPGSGPDPSAGAQYPRTRSPRAQGKDRLLEHHQVGKGEDVTDGETGERQTAPPQPPCSPEPGLSNEGGRADRTGQPAQGRDVGCHG